MDWSRAKTILIVAFVLLNLFLVAQLNDMMLQKSSIQVERADKELVTNLLKESQITLTPDSFVESKQLVPSPYKATITELEGWQKNERGGYTKTFSEPLTSKKPEELKRFLQENVPYFSEYKPVDSTSSSTKQLIYIQQGKNGYPIYDGRIEVSCPDGTCTVRVVHYELKEASQESEKPTDYYTAIYRLITSGELATKSTISSVQLVYRAKSIPNASEDIILVPYWHFHVDSKIYELNATYRGLSENVEVVSDNLQLENKGKK